MINDLQLSFSIDGKQVALDVIGTLDNPITLEFESLPSPEEIRTDHPLDALIPIARPDEDKVIITINAARAKESEAYPKKIFSGDYSSEMWGHISKAKSKRDLRDALYFVCCRIQELEEELK